MNTSTFSLHDAEAPRTLAGADPYKAAADWDTDRELQRDRSARLMGNMLKGACVVIVALGATVTALALRPEPLPGVVVVDRQSGATTFAQSLDAATVPQEEMLDKSNIERFVRAREGYVYRQLQADMDTVARMSTPEVFAPYYAPFDDAGGKKPRDQQWKGNVEQAVQVVGTQLRGAARDGSTGRDAETTFDVVTTYLDGSREPTRERFIATVRYEYRPKMKMKEADRKQNVFGWIATWYKADPMVAGSRL